MPRRNGRWFVITGTGRSGTQYISRIMRLCAVMCTHERINFRDRLNASGEFESRLKAIGADGDSSWCIAAMMKYLPKDCVVFHQVRNPVKTIRSGLANDVWFQSELCPRHEGRKVLADRHGIDFTWSENLEERAVSAMRFWVEWNRLIEREAAEYRLDYYRHRLEDVDRNIVSWIATVSGSPVHPSLCQEALDTFSRGFGGVPESPCEKAKSINWESLPDCTEKAEIEALALKYGYRLKDLESA